MATSSKLGELARTLIACLAVAAVAYFGSIWFLQSTQGVAGEQEAVRFSEAVQQEANDFRADFQAAVELIRARWSYLDHRTELGELRLDELAEEAHSILGEEPDAKSFYFALVHLVSGLHDGHAFVAPATAVGFGRQRWPFTLTEVVEGIMVHTVADGTESVQPGDLLLAVDGRPIEAWISETEHRVFASSDLARRRYAIAHLARWDDAVDRSFRLRSRDGSEREVRLALPYAFDEVPSQRLVPRERAHRLLEGGLAYFRPGNFSPPPNSGWPGPPEERDAILAETYAEFDRIIQELREAPGLILDLRGNPGGTDLLGQFLVDRLVDGDYIYFQLSARRGGGWGGFGKHGSSAAAGKHSMAGKPLAVLVDSATFSTADNVASCLRDVHPDVRFVGRPNGAGSGAPRPFELPRTGTKIYFCTQRVKSASGRMNEGVPVPIDFPVRWTRDDVLEGRDPDLAAAITALSR